AETRQAGYGIGSGHRRKCRCVEPLLGAALVRGKIGLNAGHDIGTIVAQPAGRSERRSEVATGGVTQNATDTPASECQVCPAWHVPQQIVACANRQIVRTVESDLMMADVIAARPVAAEVLDVEQGVIHGLPGIVHAVRPCPVSLYGEAARNPAAHF